VAAQACDVRLEAQVDALRAKVIELITELAGLRQDLHDSQADAANAAANAIAGLRRDVVPFVRPGSALVTWQARRPR